MTTTESYYDEDARRGTAGTATHRETRTDLGLMDLVSKLARDVNELISRESRLVRAEIGDKVAGLQAAIGLMISGAACLLVALFILAMAIVTALAEVMGAGWAALAVGVTLAIIGAILAMQGAKRMKPSHFYPERSVHQVREDAEMAREQVR